MKVNAGNLKKGQFILHQGNIWQVQKTEFSFHGRGLAVMRTKLKNVKSRKNIDYTLKTNEDVELVNVETVEMQYLYKDSQSAYFMNERSFSQYSIPLQLIEFADFLKEGEKYYILLYEGEPISVRSPLSARLKIIETEEAAKGDTVSGAKKPAKVETGVTVMVPLFIKTGDTIMINPETGEYVERVKS